MDPALDVVITGLGVVSPVGIGRQAFWQSLCEGRSGVKPITVFDMGDLPLRYGGEVTDFDPKKYVAPRKSIKLMCREIQLGVAAASSAYDDADLGSAGVDPDRIGVVFGSEMLFGEPSELANLFSAARQNGQFTIHGFGQSMSTNLFPLWLLMYLPNMPGCHMGINHDLRGPNNTIVQGEASGLLALAEAADQIYRGAADVMICGSSGTRITPMRVIHQQHSLLSDQTLDPAVACRPFDVDRTGQVNGEGSCVLVLERRDHALARGANILASYRSVGRAFGCHPDRPVVVQAAIAQSANLALRKAGLGPQDVGHVNAHGISKIEEDRTEAEGIRAVLGDVPVTAPKSYFGNLGAGTGLVELAASILGMKEDQIPVTMNYHTPDPSCPVNVIHHRPLTGAKKVTLAMNQSPTGQAVAVVITE